MTISDTPRKYHKCCDYEFMAGPLKRCKCDCHDAVKWRNI